MDVSPPDFYLYRVFLKYAYVLVGGRRFCGDKCPFVQFTWSGAGGGYYSVDQGIVNYLYYVYVNTLATTLCPNLTDNCPMDFVNIYSCCIFGVALTLSF